MSAGLVLYFPCLTPSVRLYCVAPSNSSFLRRYPPRPQEGGKSIAASSALLSISDVKLVGVSATSRTFKKISEITGRVSKMKNQPFQSIRKSLYDPREHDACGVGFIARLDAQPTHKVLEDALMALGRMAHRGGSGCGPKAADGAGLMVALPRAFMRRVWQPLCGALPEEYGIGHFFMPREPELCRQVEKIVEETLAGHDLRVLGWRDTPVQAGVLQKHALAGLPRIRQLAVARAYGVAAADEGEAFERLLYVARKHMEQDVLSRAACTADDFHVASFSGRGIVYKGMLPGGRLAAFYSDLAQPDFASCFAIFHERYSTNTRPSWRLAQPFHCLAHNGEINTLRGNINNMRMREPFMHSELFGADMRYLKPVLDRQGSDSAMLDNAMELLLRGGRTLAHAAMMLVPEPFGATYIMGDDKRAFYEYHAALMEPWDGPSALVFSDGWRQIGAQLDRNALRPCRYIITKDNTVILASEAGVLDIPEAHVARRGRLGPRRMLMVDFARHRVVTDAECKNRVIYSKPYRHWVREHGVTLRDLPLPPQNPATEPEGQDLLRQQYLYGFSKEELVEIIAPMAKNAQEPMSSMGLDTPLAVLSQKPQLLFHYLKQCFAQVTNPPIDPLREGLVMTLTGFAGRRGNVLDEVPGHYSLLRLPNPVLMPDDLRRMLLSEHPAVKAARLDMLFDVPKKRGSAALALEKGLKSMCVAADKALEQGCTILALSDARSDALRAPIPSLLAVSALHQHLLRSGRRLLCGIVADTGEAREVMHLAQLIAFGAAAVHPRVAWATVEAMSREGLLGKNDTPLKARAAYSTALQKGLLKTFSRMGISTLRSFIHAQGFEAVGLNKEFVDKYFTGLPSRIGGIGLESVAFDALARHSSAFEGLALRREGAGASPVAGGEAFPASSRRQDAAKGGLLLPPLPDTGRFKPRNAGERHLWTTKAVRSLHRAVRENDAASFAEYAAESDNQTYGPVTLRSLLRFRAATPVTMEEVEPEENILRRFVGAAMSFGSISSEAHRAIAVAFNRVGGRSNCGEGGEDAARCSILPDGSNPRSKVRQIASGRFGVTAFYLAQADEIQIKMAQGAKPGEGGQLPAHKVLPEIARVRGTTPGVTLISPPPHHDIYSIEDLAQLIFDLKRFNPTAKVSVKLVAGSNVGTIASGVAKAGADIILVSGHDGGTGASPRSAIAHVGLPWELGLAETQSALLHNGMRRMVKLQTDGQLRTGRDLAVAALLGAEEFGFGAGLLVALGCCMLRVCHLGSCPAGIAAQDATLRARQKGTAEHVERYLRFLAADMRKHMAALGFRTVDEMIGRADMLEPAPLPALRQTLANCPWLDESTAKAWLGKLGNLDFSRVLHCDGVACRMPEEDANQESMLSPFEDSPLETELLRAVRPSLSSGRPACFEGIVSNTDRSVCARLAGEIARTAGEAGLRPGTVEIVLKGTAGQSAGAFLTRGVRLYIKGEANDYVGKGLSGGIISVAPAAPDALLFLNMNQEQAVIGNVALYGATSGELYVGGSAGERFAVRNSGASAVVEGVGDHACEYMTGGVVVVLGQTGYNFAAGMSGGLAFVYDRAETFQTRCNLDSVDIASVWRAEDVSLLRSLIEKHLAHTGSPLSRALLGDWSAQLPLFFKITPLEYANALERIKRGENPGAESVPATEEVFRP